MGVAFSLALSTRNCWCSLESCLKQWSLASSSACKSSSDSSSFLVASAHRSQSCGSLLRTSPVALLPVGKNRTQSSGLFLSSSICSCLTANTNSRLAARPQWSGGMPAARSRSWRNCRKIACSCGEARVSARDRGLGGADPMLLDLDIVDCGATTC